ncbi:MAG TPA: hypothetical protein VMH04_01540 [Candidatus Solibacter sp.]|nr:hypothetical protein [Candidatus Solibacter sp.]
MSLGPPSFTPFQRQSFLSLALTFLLTASLSAQKQDASPSAAPQYNSQTEMKTKGIVEEVKPVPFGTRKDFTQLIVKSGDDTLTIYVCPKPFQDEMGITFAKGDEIAITGSKVKQETAEVILARQLVKGTDTLMFRDDKGKPVWDPRTGK